MFPDSFVEFVIRHKDCPLYGEHGEACPDNQLDPEETET